MKIGFTLNGAPVCVEAPGTVSLLTLLRDYCRLTGTKRGCDIGECGACTVLLDDRAVTSCMVMAGQVQGRLTKSRAYPGSKFRKIVCLFQPVICLFPVAVINQVIPLRHQIMQRTAACHPCDHLSRLAERDAACHTSGALYFLLFF